MARQLSVIVEGWEYSLLYSIFFYVFICLEQNLTLKYSSDCQPESTQIKDNVDTPAFSEFLGENGGCFVWDVYIYVYCDNTGHTYF